MDRVLVDRFEASGQVLLDVIAELRPEQITQSTGPGR